MNKFIIALMALAGMQYASAGNLVVNGDFEDENYTYDTPYAEWEPDFYVVQTLPGWQLGDGLDPWNMALSIFSHEYMEDIDDVLIKEGNKNFAFLRRYSDNAWATGSFSQIISGLEVGEEYYLDALVSQNNGTAPNCTDFSHGFIVKENNANGKQIFKESAAAQEGQDWFRYERKFKATSSTIYLEVYYANPWRGGQGQPQTSDSWFAVDNVMIYPAAEYAEMHPDPVEEPDPVDPSTIDYTDHMVNGDFEDENYTFDTPYDWEPDFQFITYLPGWQLGDGLDPWNMSLSMFSHEYMEDIDGEIITEDNTTFAFLRRFKENAWATGAFSQIVTDLEEGKEYYLDALVSQNDGTAPGCSDFSHGFIVNDRNANGDLIFRENSAAQEGQDWFRYERKFKARSSQVYIEVYYVNPWRGGQSQPATDDSWFAIDNIKLYDANAYDHFHSEVEAGIANVAVRPAMPEGVYNLQGFKVADTPDQLGERKGIFIVRSAERTSKLMR